MERITQEQFDEMVRRHQVYLDNEYAVEGAILLHLHDVDLSGLVFPREDDADLSSIELWRCNLTGVDARGALLSSSSLKNCNLTEADFRGAKLLHCDMTGATAYLTLFTGADISNADLRRAKLNGSDLRDANLNDAVLVNVDASTLVDLRKNTSHVTNFESADLTDANCAEGNFSECDFTGATLDGADFGYTKIMDAKMLRATVNAANFVGATGDPQSLPNNVDDAIYYASSIHPLLYMSLSEALTALGVSSDTVYIDDEEYWVVWDDNAPNDKALLAREMLESSVTIAALNSSEEELYGASTFWSDVSFENLTDPFLRYKVALQLGISVSPMSVYISGVDMQDAIAAIEEAEEVANVEVSDGGDGVILSNVHATMDAWSDLRDAERAIKELHQSEAEASVAYGRQRPGVKALRQVTMPMKVAAFKRTFPEAFETIKHDIGGGTLDPASARQLIDRFGMTWQVTRTRWTSELQRWSPKPNEVLQLNIDIPVVTDDPEVIKTLEAIRQTSYQSSHPVRHRGLFTIGWVRYSVFESEGVLLVEEVQSDLPIVRKGLDDQEFQRQLLQRGLTKDFIEDALNIMQPYVNRFYFDALSLVFDIAHEAGLSVEMLSYAQKARFDSPRSLYEDLPKKMGMKKGKSDLKFLQEAPSDKVWKLKPNPVRRKRARVKLPKKFTWARR